MFWPQAVTARSVYISVKKVIDEDEQTSNAIKEHCGLPSKLTFPSLKHINIQNFVKTSLSSNKMKFLPRQKIVSNVILKVLLVSVYDFALMYLWGNHRQTETFWNNSRQIDEFLDRQRYFLTNWDNLGYSDFIESKFWLIDVHYFCKIAWISSSLFSWELLTPSWLISSSK